MINYQIIEERDAPRKLELTLSGAQQVNYIVLYKDHLGGTVPPNSIASSIVERHKYSAALDRTANFSIGNPPSPSRMYFKGIVSNANPVVLNGKGGESGLPVLSAGEYFIYAKVAPKGGASTAGNSIANYQMVQRFTVDTCAKAIGQLKVTQPSGNPAPPPTTEITINKIQDMQFLKSWYTGFKCIGPEGDENILTPGWSKTYQGSYSAENFKFQAQVNGKWWPFEPKLQLEEIQEKEEPEPPPPRKFDVKSWVVPAAHDFTQPDTWPGNAPGLVYENGAIEGSTVPVEIVSQEVNPTGWRFVRWIMDGEGDTSVPIRNTFIDGPKNVVALYVRRGYNITVKENISGAGFAQPLEFGSTTQFYFNTEAFTSAYPKPGYRFLRWERSGTGQQISDRLCRDEFVTDDETWTAIFEKVSYNIVFRGLGDGIGSVWVRTGGKTTQILNSELRSLNFKPIQVEHGDSVEFWAEADDSSEFVTWTHMPQDRLTIRQQLNNVHNHHYITVNFAKKPSKKPNPQYSFQLFCPVPTIDSEVIKYSEFHPPAVPTTECE